MMTFEAIRAALDGGLIAALDESSLRVLVALVDHLPNVCPGRSTLLRRTGLSYSTVRRACCRLRDVGIMSYLPGLGEETTRYLLADLTDPATLARIQARLGIATAGTDSTTVLQAVAPATDHSSPAPVPSPQPAENPPTPEPQPPVPAPAEKQPDRKKSKPAARAKLTDADKLTIASSPQMVVRWLCFGVAGLDLAADLSTLPPSPTNWCRGSRNTNQPDPDLDLQQFGGLWCAYVAGGRQRAGLPLRVPSVSRAIGTIKALRQQFTESQLVGLMDIVATRWREIQAVIGGKFGASLDLDEGTLSIAQVRTAAERLISGQPLPTSSAAATTPRKEKTYAASDWE